MPRFRGAWRPWLGEIPRGRQYRDRFRRHEFRAGADGEDFCQTGCGANSAARDGATSGRV